MCTSLYRKLQQYYEDKEWQLTKLATAFVLRGWYANVEWIQGQLMLTVVSQKTMDEWKAEKKKVAQRVIT